LARIVEVAIHTILRLRQVYPPDLFILRRRYDAPVYQSRHPALNEYITGAVIAIGEEMLLGVLQHVVVVIRDQLDRPLERFVFSLDFVVSIDHDDVDQPIENSLTQETLDQYFRAFMIKISSMESQLEELQPSDELNFAIVIECRPGFIPSASQSDPGGPTPWVPAQKGDTGQKSEKTQLHPVRSVETGVINMSIVIQESEEKLSRV
ncbi:mitotic spindle checkpoint HORMA domain-containing protein, partial [Clavulina sp. PMI_390]